ncbi:TPA: potassium/proton antiporter [Neisseria gonorrhoeae]|uniref:potassium/proton antiporter n=1 Tax=Neisseria gonorrhoeae TaxID=485 RepID=UPI0006585AC6|nr:potassium/proton antiporter [Neisseria gonorrhoeae]KLS38615.1 potassium transporter CPA [Neisseria gonorrhoeae ATL_2011_01_05]MCF3007940.1 potassium/proton antiporter [Neisseria gonorrhoeae]MCF3020782.1 potassium/proton antiporter [Neisseria gonorrhoeae]MCF3038804.1 potassium/proton antiporter [Neisseria gonorrhoeae]MCF3040816.1 potassium/proton antiporter [Neisseria gonorrhoeae]
MNSLFLLGGALLFLSVVSTTLSARLGMPLLLVFLAVGMLAGEEGVGGIAFNNVVMANFISQLALAVILLDGGLRTQLSSFRIALKPASVLASWGVFATVLPLGLFATFYLGLDWKFGVLMAAIVGSTDAGAVFSLLRNSGVRLNERVQATLEIESGANDPMAVFLVTALITMIMQPAESGAAAFVRMLALQIGFGLLTGWAGGKILAKLVRRLNLAEGLYALMIVSGGLLVFAFTNTIGGSGFLAVYLAGIIVGNQRNRATEHVLRVMDGLAWLAQATLFVMLGLLVSPAGVLDRAAEALAIAAFLMLVARPLAVFGGLWKFNYSLREKAYISWLGLRGAVPISLAMMPLVMGVPNSHLLFDVAFAVVVLSLLIQGTTIPVMARLLKVAMPNKPEPKDTHDIWLAEKEIVRMSAFKVVAESEAEGHHPDMVEPISDSFDARCFALIRNGSRIEMQSDTVLQAEDLAWYILPDGKVDKMAKYFTETGIGVRENFDFFGEFVVSPAARSGDLALAYGLKLEAGEEGLSLAELFDKRSDSQEPVEGDRIDIGGFMLTAKEVDGDGNIGSMGLKVPR